MTESVFVADLGGSKVAAAVLDRDGKVLARRSEEVDLSSREAPVLQMARLAAQLGASRYKYRAAGIAVPGLVRRDGTVWAPNLPEWDKVPLARMLRTKLRVPVVVESDRNAALLGECWRGAGRGKTDVIVLIVGTGIGAGILVDGHLLRGAHELSGCAGWMAVSDHDSSEVRKYGGLEAFAAGPAVARAAHIDIVAGCGGKLGQCDPETITPEEVAELARAGDQNARKIFRRVGKMLGLAIANLISLFDPQVVVVTGGLMGAADLFWDELGNVALSRCQPISARQVRLCVSGLGAKGNLLGVGKLAWNAALEADEATPNKRKATPGITRMTRIHAD
jgi:glucokinase